MNHEDICTGGRSPLIFCSPVRHVSFRCNSRKQRLSNSGQFLRVCLLKALRHSLCAAPSHKSRARTNAWTSSGSGSRIGVPRYDTEPALQFRGYPKSPQHQAIFLSFLSLSFLPFLPPLVLLSFISFLFLCVCSSPLA